MLNPFSLLKKEPKRPERFLALDLGTVTTKVFLFSLKDGVELLGSASSPAGDLAGAVRALGEKDATTTAREAIVAIGGEFSWCLTTTVRLNRRHPQKLIGAAEVAELKEKILQTAELTAAQQTEKFFGDGWDLELVDDYLLYFKVDGQLTENPVGQSGSTLEAAFFTAFTLGSYLESLSRQLNAQGLRLWGVSALPSLTVKTLIKNLQEKKEDFDAIILDVGGETTDIILVFGGGVWGNRSLYIGGHAFTEALSLGLNIATSEAEERKRAYSSAGIATEQSVRIKEVLDSALKFWLVGIETALADFEGVKVFPERIILTGGGSALPDLKTALAAYPLRRALPFADIPAVEVVPLESLRMEVLAAEIWEDAQ